MESLMESLLDERPEHARFFAWCLLAQRPDHQHARLVAALASKHLGLHQDARADARELLCQSPPVALSRRAAALLRELNAEPHTPPPPPPLNAEAELRVHLVAPLPEAVLLGRWFTLSLRLTTEMGLSSRRTSPAAARLLLVDIDSTSAYHLELRQARRASTAEPPTLTQSRPSRAPVLWLDSGRAVVEVRATAERAHTCQRSRAVLWAEAESGEAVFYSAFSAPLDVHEPADEAPPGAISPGADDPVADELADRCSAAGARVAVALSPVGHHPGLPQLASSGAIQVFRPVELRRRGAACGQLLLAEGAASIASRVWDSGRALARWLEDADALPMRGRAVLELGSGVGIGGLAAAAHGASVVLTDLSEALPLLAFNAAANMSLCEHAPAVMPLSWGDGEQVVAAARLAWSGGSACSPLILCTDVVYDPDMYRPLLKTLDHLTSSACMVEPPPILMAHRSRHEDEHAAFFEEALSLFDMSVLKGPELPRVFGSGRARAATVEAVRLIFLERRKSER